VPGEFGHLRSNKTEVLREWSTDQLHVLPRVDSVPGVGRLRRRRLAAKRLLSSGRCRVGIEQLLQSSADVDDRQLVVKRDGERKHLETGAQLQDYHHHHHRLLRHAGNTQNTVIHKTLKP